MSDLILPVKDGKTVNQTASSDTSKTSETSKKSGGKLDKDAFLQLLVTQMKYQDPLNPSSNTEYVAQLATFSQLEQLQNLSQDSTKSQAFGLVGKYVTLTTKDNTTGNSTDISGKVDFVSISNNTVKVSVNGNLYSTDDLTSVVGDEYVKEQSSPMVTQATTLKYDAANPKNQTFDVKVGTGEYTADKVAVAMGENVLDSSLVSLKNGKVTIDKSAFEKLPNGTYKLTVAFNDANLTTVKDKVTLEVSNSTVTGDADTGSAGAGTGSTGTSTTGSTGTEGTGTSTTGSTGSTETAASGTENQTQGTTTNA